MTIPNLPGATPARPASRMSGYIFALVSSIGAGLATVVGKWNLESISPLLMNFLIFSVATIVLSVTYLPVRGLKHTFTTTRKGWLWVALFTLSSLVAVWAYWAGVQRMDPSLAAFLNRSEVAIAIFLGIVLLKERLSRMEILGLLTSLFGIVVMRLTLRMEYSDGFWLVLLGSLFFGLTEFISKIAVRHVEPIKLAYLRNMFMAAVYGILFAAGGRGYEGLERVWPGVLALGLLGPIVSRMAYLSALRRLELSKVAIISQTQPVFVIAVALAVFGQLPTVREFTGGVFLILGCALMVLFRKR